MMVWLGVVGTVLAVVGCGVCLSLYLLFGILRDLGKAMRESTEEFATMEKRRFVQDDSILKHADVVNADFLKATRSENDRFLSVFEATSKGITRSHDQLSENFGALLRELRLSKSLLEGQTLLANRTVQSIKFLEKFIEMIQTGSRSPNRNFTTDAEAAESESGNISQYEAIVDGIERAQRAAEDLV